MIQEENSRCNSLKWTQPCFTVSHVMWNIKLKLSHSLMMTFSSTCIFAQFSYSYGNVGIDNKLLPLLSSHFTFSCIMSVTISLYIFTKTKKDTYHTYFWTHTGDEICSGSDLETYFSDSFCFFWCIFFRLYIRNNQCFITLFYQNLITNVAVKHNINIVFSISASSANVANIPVCGSVSLW